MSLEKDILKYCEEKSTLPSGLLQELERFTYLKKLQPHMISGSFQGRLLAMLSKLSKPKRILELGTFTGYATLCLAEGLSDDGIIHTIEYDKELEEDLKHFFKRSEFAEKIHLHIMQAEEAILCISEPWDLIFIDADKKNYSKYFELLADHVPSGCLIVSDNVLWKGRVVEKDWIEKDAKTRSFVEFNDIIKADSRFETIIVPIRDGLSLARKK